MTNVNLWKCDRCGTFSKSRKGYYVIRLFVLPITILKLIRYIFSIELDFTHVSIWDFCEDCTNNFTKWISRGRK